MERIRIHLHLVVSIEDVMNGIYDIGITIVFQMILSLVNEYSGFEENRDISVILNDESTTNC